jgi:hypothetical protein
MFVGEGRRPGELVTVAEHDDYGSPPFLRDSIIEAVEHPNMNAVSDAG